MGVETDRGLWVQALVAAGYQVYAINPRSVARYRERHGLSGAKSDRGDAKVLADLVRTDRHNHRQVAGDSAEVRGITVLARVHQKLIRERTRHTLMLRAALREFYPQALATFDDLAGGDALAVLERAPTPDAGARMSVSQIRAALKRAGRQRYLDKRSSEIQAGLRTEQLTAPPPVAKAYGATSRATVAILIELNRQISQLETELATDFEQHPDADIYLSQPGLGVVLGARVLGEFGDDPDRYADVKSRRNYAGTSPITIASGKHRSVIARYVRNRRLSVDRWAYSSLNASAGQSPEASLASSTRVRCKRFPFRIRGVPAAPGCPSDLGTMRLRNRAEPPYLRLRSSLLIPDSGILPDRGRCPNWSTRVPRVLSALEPPRRPSIGPLIP